MSKHVTLVAIRAIFLVRIERRKGGNKAARCVRMLDQVETTKTAVAGGQFIRAVATNAQARVVLEGMLTDEGDLQLTIVELELKSYLKTRQFRVLRYIPDLRITNTGRKSN